MCSVMWVEPTTSCVAFRSFAQLSRCPACLVSTSGSGRLYHILFCLGQCRAIQPRMMQVAGYSEGVETSTLTTRDKSVRSISPSVNHKEKSAALHLVSSGGNDTQLCSNPPLQRTKSFDLTIPPLPLFSLHTFPFTSRQHTVCCWLPPLPLLFIGRALQ